MLALFGGSFNPIHLGHLLIAKDVLDDFHLKSLIFVPAYVQPLKGKLLLPPELRLQLIKISIRGVKGFSFWDYELKKGGRSYTVDTLRKFVEIHGEKPFFVMGSDSFETFHKWKEPEEILNLSKLIVVKRAGEGCSFSKVLEKIPKIEMVEVRKGEKITFEKFKGKNVILYDGRKVEISSTEIRERLKKGKSIKYMVTEEAEKILRRWWENAFSENV